MNLAIPFSYFLLQFSIYTKTAQRSITFLYKFFRYYHKLIMRIHVTWDIRRWSQIWRLSNMFSSTGQTTDYFFWLRLVFLVKTGIKIFSCSVSILEKLRIRPGLTSLLGGGVLCWLKTPFLRRINIFFWKPHFLIIKTSLLWEFDLVEFDLSEFKRTGHIS